MKAKVRSILTGRKLATRDRLALGHLDLVESIAVKLHSRLPPCFDLDDLVQAGMLGLLEAASQYDPTNHPGVAFGAFARRRIKGEMQDSVGMHSSDGATRTTRENRWNEATRYPIMEHDGRSGGSKNHARTLKEFGNAEYGETPDPSPNSRADGMTERTEQREMLNRQIRALPRRQAVVIELHYGEGLALTRIAHTRELDVGHGRIKQLHKEALRTMRAGLGLRGMKQAA